MQGCALHSLLSLPNMAPHYHYSPDSAASYWRGRRNPKLATALCLVASKMYNQLLHNPCISMDSATCCLSGCRVLAAIGSIGAGQRKSLPSAHLAVTSSVQEQNESITFHNGFSLLKNKHSFYYRKWLILSMLAAVLFPSVQYCYCKWAVMPFSCSNSQAKVLATYLSPF